MKATYKGGYSLELQKVHAMSEFVIVAKMKIELTLQLGLEQFHKALTMLWRLSH